MRTEITFIDTDNAGDSERTKRHWFEIKNLEYVEDGQYAILEQENEYSGEYTFLNSDGERIVEGIATDALGKVLIDRI